MLRQRSLRPLFFGLQAAALLGLGLLYGCGQDKSTTLEPERGGPLAARHALPPIGALPDAPSPAPTPTPIGLPPGQWNSAGDIDGDSTNDLLVANGPRNVVRVLRCRDGATFNFTELRPLPVVNPRDVILGDVNGDGLPDVIAFSASTLKASIFLNAGRGEFEQAATVSLPADHRGMVAGDYDEDGQADIFFATPNQDFVWVVQDASDGYALVRLTTSAFRDRVEAQTAAHDCGDEPDCSTTPEGPGFHACTEAAKCAFSKCMWAACVNHGGGGSVWRKARYVGAVAACAAAYAIDQAACVPTQFIPKIKLGSGLPQKASTLTDRQGVSLLRQMDDAGHSYAKLNYYVKGGEVRVNVVNITDGIAAWDTTCVVGAYPGALTILDDGQFLEMRDAGGKAYGPTLEQQADLGLSALESVQMANPPARKGIGPFLIPLGPCCLVIGWSPEGHKNCLVSVLACDTDGDFKPDFCRMLVICPFGGRSGYYDCSRDIRNN